MSFYFAFGSNMNPDRVRTRGLKTTATRSGVLKGYELVFNKVSGSHPETAHANVQYKPGAEVEGVLYQLCSAAEIVKMDVFENAPVNYSREMVTIYSAEGEVFAWTYFANSGVLQLGKKPSPAYLAHLLAGRKYLSTGYYDWLSNQPTTND